MATGRIIENGFSTNVSVERYLHCGPLRWSDTLFICDDETPPEYDGAPSNTSCLYLLISGIQKHCEMVVDLREIPVRGFHKKNGPHGRYYNVSFELGLVFGAGGIEFTFLFEGTILGAVKCAYF
jgi:hypothetical protein